ncbi:PASTA domain-containing protein [Pengzhenrongella sicca]|uniref:PASTA domain-containing protein n=1 Tax=Pengzhenrongella sicca TaxID=2819238 RepID=A0A8A4ZHX5_9MICO|nr:PASTA domain-containing protein [Pengzhenrongella sicca]QTE30126.1 PASTA domain-containing protein [Pengzhenrongella sicca]
MHRLNSALRIAAAVALGGLTWSLPAVTTDPAPALDPQRTLAGRDLLVTGTGFPASDPVEPVDCALTATGPGFDGSCLVDAAGELTGTLVIPADAKPGVYTVTARANGGSASAPVEVLAGVEVPNLIGGTLAEAQRALTAVELSLGGPTSGDGTVVDQDPAPGRTVEPGSTVDVTLAPIVETLVRVPDLRGLSITAARAALTEAGLVLGDASADPQDVVDGQAPTPGESVAAGTVVSVEVAVAGDETAPTPWLLVGALTLVAVVAVVAVVAATAAARASRPRPRRPDPVQPRLELHPHPDTAVAPRVVAHDDRPLPELRLEPHADHRVDPAHTDPTRTEVSR